MRSCSDSRPARVTRCCSRCCRSRTCTTRGNWPTIWPWTTTARGAICVKAYEKVDPIAVLPVLNRLVLSELVETGAQHYQIAARRLKKMRKLAAGSEHEAEVD